MEQQKELFKLCFAAGVELAGLILLSMLIWLPVPVENRALANLAMGVITTTIITTPISYLLGGNPKGASQGSAVSTNSDTTNVTVTPASSDDQKI